MSDARIEEIRARANAATDGHWGTNYDGKGTYTVEARPGLDLTLGPVNEGAVATLTGEYGGEQTYQDARFIAHAREDVPYLLDRVAELEARLRAHAHELGERLRNIHTSGEGAAWNWWDAAVIPGECADLIDPLCGKTHGIGTSVPYRPCARPAGHPEAYCQDATGDHLFLAAPEEATP